MEEANDPDEENIHKVEVSMGTGKDHASRNVDLVNLINPVRFFHSLFNQPFAHFSINLSLLQVLCSSY